MSALRAGLRRDVVVNVAFSLLKAVALLWAIRIAGERLLPAALGVFLLARRVSSTGGNLLQLGMSQTLLRELPINHEVPSAKLDFLVSATMVWAALAATVIPLAWLERSWLATHAFPGAPDAPALAFWTCALMVATVLYFVAGSVLVAERAFVRANLYDFVCVSGLIALAFILLGRRSSAVTVLQWQTIGTAALSALVVGSYLVAWRGHRVRGALARTAPTFARYGLPRGVITCLDVTLLLVGPWLLRDRPSESGFFSLSLVPVQIMVVAISPVAQIASVITARLTGRGADAAIGEGVRLVFGMLIYATALAMAALLPWSDWLLALWLGDSAAAAGAAEYFRVSMWGILPLAVFAGLKSIIEVRWTQPRNLWSLVVALVVHLIGFVLLRTVTTPGVAAVGSFVLALWTLGALTVGWLWSDYLRPVGQWGLGRLAATAAVLGIMNLLLADIGGVTAFSTALLLSGISVVVAFGVRPPPVVRSVLGFINPRLGRIVVTE